MDEDMNSHLFPHIGKVIASTGSRHFPRMLHDLIRTQLAVDATHIRQMRVESVVARSEPDPATEAALLAETLFCEHSDALPPVPATTATDASQLHLTRRKDGYRYVISVYRNDQSERFSARERSLLQDISRFCCRWWKNTLTPCNRWIMTRKARRPRQRAAGWRLCACASTNVCSNWG